MSIGAEATDGQTWRNVGGGEGRKLCGVRVVTGHGNRKCAAWQISECHWGRLATARWAWRTASPEVPRPSPTPTRYSQVGAGAPIPQIPERLTGAFEEENKNSGGG